MKKSLSERDICTKFITPALQQAGWDSLRQIREEVTFTAGRVIVRGKLHTRGRKKRADYILFHKPNIPIAPYHPPRTRSPAPPNHPQPHRPRQTRPAGPER
jgi:type I site-specific restriction endonuclease